MKNNKMGVSIGAFALLFILSLSGLAMVNGANDIRDAKIELLQEQLKEASAPSEKLNKYVAERVEIISEEEENTNTIRLIQDANVILSERKAVAEKQIRCQRAVNVGMQEGDCSIESVYNLFSL